MCVKIKNKLYLFFMASIILAAIFSFTLNNHAYVYADSPADQTPYQIVLDNGNKIFYMYAGYDYDKSMQTDDYLKSGLYYNNETLENIYLINPPEATYGRYFMKAACSFRKTELILRIFRGHGQTGNWLAEVGLMKMRNLLPSMGRR